MDSRKHADGTQNSSAPRLPQRAAAAGKLTGKHERPFEEKSRLFLNGNMSPSCLTKWGIGTTCRKGFKKSSANQDDFFVYCCDEWGLYGVFDGHGPGGHYVSNYVQWHLPNIIHDQISARGSVSHALTKSFLRVNSMLKEASDKQNFDSASSGSTASVVLHRRHENKLFIANVGDSKVVLATRNRSGHLIAERLTEEHKPNDPMEKQRIETCGGEVRRPAGHVPHRVFIKGRNYPGLAMSRSIGDSLGHTAGVTPVPDVKERTVVEGIDEYLIMCSDGVWEFISDQEAVDIVSRFPVQQADKAVAELSSQAWKRWVDQDGRSVDDITAQISWSDKAGVMEIARKIHGEERTPDPAIMAAASCYTHETMVERQHPHVIILWGSMPACKRGVGSFICKLCSIPERWCSVHDKEDLAKLAKKRHALRRCFNKSSRHLS